MTPEFPTFKKLEITDKNGIEHFTKQYPPYSDYNFTSMWSWDTKGEAHFSVLNDNLIIKFSDYVTDEPFYSFLGSHNVQNTIERLMAFIRSEGITPSLRLIPEHSIQENRTTSFLITEDRDNFDYVYSLDKLRTYEGSEYEQSRNMKNRFTRKYEKIQIVPLDLTKLNDRKIIQNLNQQWEMNKEYRLDNEEDAMARLLFPGNNFPLMSLGLLVNGNPVAFSISEVLNNGYAISHFVKADTQYSGVYSYLMYATATELSTKGCTLLNYEQDLGIPGLRYAKDVFRPVHFLKKYIIEDQKI
ncbi:MAG: hypothetical protein A3D99_00960 [Candidatus Andersenbacteria bacterium RIFCSPHIGHO2_12_FULL_45_11]|uniref:Phosphatidylglycerol lysyltransferase C-terminal domain-containing protein n=1 Tax=Candidatus Andersenbacteria bacterium RIFCSPHIGHO2_12_FULL_45_11 TaxID=1797281 RepID=A0A1G1X5C1_9BACT|nr:MAG: hypothetical protein A3D99_00960 [Candidatus Andersenbacteria bacterium RIFCSPHIGHO2_12_FULL_45_11]